MIGRPWPHLSSSSAEQETKITSASYKMEPPGGAASTTELTTVPVKLLRRLGLRRNASTGLSNLKDTDVVCDSDKEDEEKIQVSLAKFRTYFLHLF